jgi:hypothetical protein
MFWLGFSLMIIGMALGFTSIYKATKQEASATKLGWMCYGGLFLALLGAVLIGKVW